MNTHNCAGLKVTTEIYEGHFAYIIHVQIPVYVALDSCLLDLTAEYCAILTIKGHVSHIFRAYTYTHEKPGSN